MKYDSLRKTARDQMILEYAQQHPEHSKKEIGKVFGISHARVFQILKKFTTAIM